MTTAAEILESVNAAGGQLWLVEGEKLRYRLPEKLAPLVEVIREQKTAIVELLAQRQAMPAGVRLVRWEPKAASVRLSKYSTVTNTQDFIESTLRQLAAALEGRFDLAGNWGLHGLLERLAAVGCVVALDDPQRALQ